jgi:hypothetical protein
MAQAIDLDALGEALAAATTMIAYYAKDRADKAAQNAAMEAAGLKPLHGDYTITWAAQHEASYRKQADALRAVLSHFGADQAEAA